MRTQQIILLAGLAIGGWLIYRNLAQAEEEQTMLDVDMSFD